MKHHEHLAVAAFALIAIAALGSSVPDYVEFVCAAGDCVRAAEADGEWFNPSYSHNEVEVARAIRDRWLVGDHVYATRDLMGRRI